MRILNDSMIKTFIAIYEQGSIGKAAIIIGKTKPNIRKTLNNLENELNVSLFNRCNSGVEPTNEGNKFYETVKYLTYSIGELEKYYEASKCGLELSLATNYMDYIMDYFCKTIKEKGIDNTKYRYVSTHSDEILRMLLEDRCGIGIFSFTSKNIRNIICFIKDTDYYYIGIESPYGSCMDGLKSIPIESDDEIYVVLSYKKNYLNSQESKYFLELLKDFFKGGK